MQTTLLGLALALIVAIAAALAAPLFVDWNQWRAAFEDRATLLAGAPVRIRGPIEATILPVPAFILRDVAIGDPDGDTGVRAEELRGNLSLGPLLRGVFEAEDFVLVQPAMRLTIERDGRLILPIIATEPADAESLSLSRIAIERGSLIVEDRANRGYLVFDNVSAKGELRSRAGPVRLDASLHLEGRRWAVRATTGRFGGDNAAKLRLLIERPDDGVSLDAEGVLTLARAQPYFAGKFTFARRGGQGLAWRMTASAAGNGKRVELDQLELSFGGEQAPVELSGNASFEPRPQGLIEAALKARRIDLDRGNGAKAADGLLPAIAPVQEALTLLSSLPLTGRIGIAVDGLVAGGGTMRELHTDIGLREGALRVEKIEARLPGLASIRAAGNGAGRHLFSGDATLEAEQPAVLVRWLFGSAAAAKLEDAGALRASGRVELAPDRLAIDQLDFSLGEGKLGGRFLIAENEGAGRTRIETDLAADGLDLDLVAPLLRAAAGSAALDLNLVLQGKGLRVLGRTLRGVDATLIHSPAGIQIERLAVEDFDGLSAKASGSLMAPWERPSGKIAFEIEAARADGLAVIAQALAGEDMSALVRRIAGTGTPVKISGTASGDGSASGIAIEAAGRLSDLPAILRARIDPQAGSLAEARLVVEAREAGRLVSLFGLSPGPPAPGEGRLEISVAKPHQGALPVRAQLSVPGANIAGLGEIRVGEGGRLEPAIELRLEAADLRPLLAAAAQASERELSASGGARLVRAGEAIAFENLAVNVGGAETRGRLTVGGMEKPAIAGKLAIDQTSLAKLLTLALGRAGEGSPFWSAARFGTPPLAGATGTVEMEVSALELSGPQVATASKFKFRFGANDAAVEDFTAELAGGKLAGQARFVRGETLAFDGRLTLGAFEVARLLAPGDGRAAARGRGNLTLALAGNGRTPSALAASLAGQGTLALEAVEIDRLDPGALAAVLAASRSAAPPDEAGTLALIAPALERAPLHLDKLETPVMVASGIARAGKARASAGSVDVTAEGVLDLARLTVDVAVELVAPAPEGLGAKPAATVRWRGPLGAPERGIEAAALSTAIALAAMERETQRLERRERAVPSAQAPRRTDTVPQPARAAAAPSAGAPDEPSTAALPFALPQSVPLPPRRPRGAGSLTIMAPPLAPPTEIRPVPGFVPPPPSR